MKPKLKYIQYRGWWISLAGEGDYVEYAMLVDRDGNSFLFLVTTEGRLRVHEDEESYDRSYYLARAWSREDIKWRWLQNNIMLEDLEDAEPFHQIRSAFKELEDLVDLRS